MCELRLWKKERVFLWIEFRKNETNYKILLFLINFRCTKLEYNYNLKKIDIKLRRTDFKIDKKIFITSKNYIWEAK